jgi:hypothetical protein
MRHVTSSCVLAQGVTDWQPFQTCDKAGSDPSRIAVELEAVKARQELAIQRLHFHPRQMEAQAQMRAMAKRQMSIRSAVDPEGKRVREDFLIAVR